VWEAISAELASNWPDASGHARAGIGLLLAGLLGALVGLQGELTGKVARSRAHTLVSLGTASVVVVAIGAGMPADALSRVVQGLVTGIGFIGAGAILKRSEQREIVGLTTAAGPWMTAALGVIAGLGQYAVALPASLLALFVLGAMQKFDSRLDKKPPLGQPRCGLAATPAVFI